MKGILPLLNKYKVDTIDDLPAEVKKQFGLEKQKKKTFTAEHERRYALRVLALISDLKQTERDRVLRKAIAKNKV